MEIPCGVKLAVLNNQLIVCKPVISVYVNMRDYCVCGGYVFLILCYYYYYY